VSAPRFTAEQSAAIEDRAGSALLAASAGSGKTAVMVERLVEAVRVDGVPVSAVLALTFTEKAAGELRERVRRRLLELGEDEHARAVDGAWIGTIHGFCARVLRSRPLAAGLDPHFDVLDEPAARRLAGQAYDRALDEWAAALGAPAVDLAAAYGAGLRELVLGAHDTLRSRGAAHPHLPIPPERPAPDPAALATAAAEALRSLGAAGDGKRVTEARAALEACIARFPPPTNGAGAADVPLPSALDPGKLGTGAKALVTAPCDAYREAWTAHRAACADHHARAALVLLDDLLDRFGTAYAQVKAARAGLDFEDLQLGVRELLADEAERERWAERFVLIMVDEFQDTNRLQLDLLEALERGNLFAVGDEFQSIYRFRHADVTIFRERRERLDADRVRGLTANFRSGEELLDVLNGAFAPELGPEFRPLVAGGERVPAGADLRLFDPDPAPGDPPVELLVTDSRGWEEHEPALGLAGLGAQPWRRAEARLVAHRLREEVDAGRRPGDVVVLVRATASLRLFEQALEEQGLPTYVVGGRGYWSQEQVRDGVAYLAALANPHDEHALYGVLASPFCGAGSDALVLLATAGRDSGRGAWAALHEAAAGTGPSGGAALAPHGGAAPVPDRAAAPDPGTEWLAAVPEPDRARLLAFARCFAAERALGERLAVEVLLERAIVATGYDLAVLARAGGDRRLANLRKLMRLARDYERAEGRDLRGFLAYAATQDLAQAREGEAALESDGLDAVRLMTIHRAKGLEFPVVCVADLGRQGASGRERLLVGRDGSAGLRLAALGGGDTVPALGYERLAAEEDQAEAQEERRLFYVAMTRAREQLILSGHADCERWPDPRAGGPPLDWIARALTGDPRAAFAPEAPDRTLERTWDGRPARLRCRLNAPATLGTVLPAAALAPSPPPRASHLGTALPAEPKVMPTPLRPRPAPQRLSYSSLQDHARCGYRYYLQRVLGLPREAPPPLDGAAPGAPEDARLDPRVRGTLVHVLLEELDFARPAAPTAAEVGVLARTQGVALTPADVDDVRALVAAFAASPLCARLAGAHRVRREAGFAFGLETGGGGPLVNGFVDVLADEGGGARLVVDYKTDRLDGADPHEVVERDYATQRLVYALAALRDGAERVEVAYCFLEAPEDPVARSFTRAEMPALAERLVLLARGVLDERYEVTAAPHRELCADCPGRRALCSHPESRTLRPAAAAGYAGYASAGSLAGSGGPS
jgi:ATP-dependent helicase/nuclease subunit A